MSWTAQERGVLSYNYSRAAHLGADGLQRVHLPPYVVREYVVTVYGEDGAPIETRNGGCQTDMPASANAASWRSSGT